MRIISGSARGRKIVAPPGLDVRPTSDRVRQATFNALVHRGAVDGASVVDLFAGSGALGIEALSRGAEHVTFVEQDRSAHRCILDNLEHLGFGDRATVIRSDASRYVETMREQPDLVFADPPYTFANWPSLLSTLYAHLAADAIVVLETGHPLTLPDEYTIVRDQRYGATVVTLAVRAIDVSDIDVIETAELDPDLPDLSDLPDLPD